MSATETLTTMLEDRERVFAAARRRLDVMQERDNVLKLVLNLRELGAVDGDRFTVMDWSEDPYDDESFDICVSALLNSSGELRDHVQGDVFPLGYLADGEVCVAGLEGFVLTEDGGNFSVSAAFAWLDSQLVEAADDQAMWSAVGELVHDSGILEDLELSLTAADVASLGQFLLPALLSQLPGNEQRLVLLQLADDMEGCIAAGDVAECAGAVPGEVGRAAAIENRDRLYEDPASWVREYATVDEVPGQ